MGPGNRGRQGRHRRAAVAALRELCRCPPARPQCSGCCSQARPPRRPPRPPMQSSLFTYTDRPCESCTQLPRPPEAMEASSSRSSSAMAAAALMVCQRSTTSDDYFFRSLLLHFLGAAHSFLCPPAPGCRLLAAGLWSQLRMPEREGSAWWAVSRPASIQVDLYSSGSSTHVCQSLLAPLVHPHPSSC